MRRILLRVGSPSHPFRRLQRTGSGTHLPALRRGWGGGAQGQESTDGEEGPKGGAALQGPMQDRRRGDRQENPDGAAGQQEGRQRCRRALHLCVSQGCGHVDPREELSTHRLAHCEGGVSIRIRAARASSFQGFLIAHHSHLHSSAQKNRTWGLMLASADLEFPGAGCSIARPRIDSRVETLAVAMLRLLAAPDCHSCAH